MRALSQKRLYEERSDGKRPAEALLRTIASLALLLCVILLSVSCKRDHLYYEGSNTATVLVNPDWSSSSLQPNGITVFAYNASDGSLYKRFPPVSAQQKCYIKLPKGDYTLVVMNDTPQEFGGRIDFVDQENLRTLQAKGVKDVQRTQKLTEYLKTLSNSGSGAEAKATSADDMYCIVEPDTLATALYHNLHISQQQIDYFYDRPDDQISEENAIKVDVEPKRVVYKVNIKAHVKGLKYARGTTISFLRGMAGGYMMGLGEHSMEQVAHSFILNHRVFDPGSDSDGTIQASLLAFGMLGDGNNDAKYYLDINFVLINGEPYPLTFDVTDLIYIDVTLDLQLTINLNLEIELPEVIGEEGGGFDTDVTEWEDEIIDIPM